jgi:AcrR family transcriptional regulator
MAGVRAVQGPKGAVRPRDDARMRILDAAYELFARNGIQAVGVDRIIAEARVAKATLYHHFASKAELALAFLDLRAERWTRDWLEAEVERLAERPRERALTVFDVLDQWFHRPDFEGCSFINTLLEIRDPADPVRAESVQQLDVIRAVFESYAEQAGAANPSEVGSQLQILAMGAIVSARRGDLEAAQRARALAAQLVNSSA